MKASEQYQGYRSYDYLGDESPLTERRWSKEIGRVPLYTGLDLNDSQKARVERLLTSEIVISLHDHPQVFPEDMSALGDVIRAGREPIGYEGLAVSGMTAVFDNGMDGFCCISSEAGWKYDDVLFDLGVRMADIAHQDFVMKCESTADIRRAHESGRVAIVFSLEAATMIDNEVDRLDVLYGFGVRQIGIAYSEANSLGSGLSERGDGGLTRLGERAVKRMNKLGIAIDVSHSGDQTAMDTIEASNVPVFITHCGSRDVWPSARMKPDSLIEACAERGGVLGLEAAPHTTISPNHTRHSLESVMDHFVHLADKVGIDHLAFGPDTLFGDHVGLHNAFSKNMSIPEATGAKKYETVEYVDGLENPGECFWNIIGWLVAHDYSDDEIKALCGGNIMRVLEEVWV